MGYRREHPTQGVGHWADCQCGLVYQPAMEVERSVFNAAYYQNHYRSDDHCRERFNQAVRVYLPLIEETLGGQHTLLDVGFGMPYFMQAARERGWTVHGADWSPDADAGDIAADRISRKGFLELDPMRDYFQLLWCSHSLETMPFREAFGQAFDMLAEPGILFLATPDAGELNRNGLTDFLHWRPKECRWMFRQDVLCREVERAGFRVLACVQQDHTRFTHPQSIHLIARKG